MAMDERTPLLRTTSRRSFLAEERPAPARGSFVDFDAKGDPENPLEWSQAYKNLVVLLLAFMSFTVTFTCVGVVPIANQIVAGLDGHVDKSSSVLLVTIWELGEAAGPLVIAPLSELYGRWRVFNAANALFVACVALAALSRSSEAFIAARFLNGCATASNVLNPAVIGDLFPSERRGSAMSLVMFAPLLGGAVGPAIAGAIVERATWRHVIWMALCLAVVAELGFFFLFRETYKVAILQRRAARLRKETGIETLKTEFDVVGDDGTSVFWETLKRPAVVFAGSSVLQLLSIYSAVIFSFFYIMSTTLPDILQNVYEFNAVRTGICFIAFSVGSAVGVFACNAFLDRIFIFLNAKHPGRPPRPENRLPFPIVTVVVFPFVVAAYGLCAQLVAPYMLLLTTVAVEGFALLLTLIPVTSYVVDAFGLHSASALTAVLITRNLAGTFLPLTTEPLIRKLGYGYAFLILAGLVVVVAPIPMIVMRFGGKWRQKSKYTKDIDT